jgi:hypothetical protein
MLHQDEAVLNASDAARYRAGGMGGGVTVNNYIQPSPGMNESELATKVDRYTERTMTRLFREMA